MAKLPNNPALLKEAGVYGYGNGLYVQIRPGTPTPARPNPQPRRTWIFRYRLHGKDRWHGLGALADVSLAEAREAAQAARKMVRAGVDPIDAQRTSEARAASLASHTFKEVALDYIETHEAGWKNAKHKQQWRNTLASYAFPTIGDLAVARVDTDAVESVLKPIWAKHETASRLRGRIEVILDFAKVKGWRDGENPARWEGHLKITLGKRSTEAPREHHAALPWQEIGAFMATLAGEGGVAALALRWAILTAARTSEATEARWSEIDLTASVWTVPASRMKAGREHKVPISDAARDVLASATKLRASQAPDAPVFPGRNMEKPLSNMSLLMLLRRIKRGDLTAHGFRSTFRDWCGEETNHPREVAEMALAHALKDKTEAAYARSDLFEKRRVLMADWSAFCLIAPVAAGTVNYQ